MFCYVCVDENWKHEKKTIICSCWPETYNGIFCEKVNYNWKIENVATIYRIGPQMTVYSLH